VVSMLRHQEGKVLTKLLPDQVSEFWEIIRYAIEQSLPPIAGEHPDKMKKILMSLLSGKSQCWINSDVGEDRRVLEAVVVTKIFYDDASDTKSLLIYCLYGYENIKQSSFTSALKTLVKYAKSESCERVIAYTNEPGVVKLVNRLGGDTSYNFISIPLH
jgi:hypothetical protein